MRPPRRVLRVAPRLLAADYWLGAGVWAVAGTRLWRTYCEDFGCIGVGIAWFAWALGYAFLLLIGWSALSAQRDGARVPLRSALLLQALACWVTGRSARRDEAGSSVRTTERTVAWVGSTIYMQRRPWPAEAPGGRIPAQRPPSHSCALRK